VVRGSRLLFGVRIEIYLGLALPVLHQKVLERVAYKK